MKRVFLSLIVLIVLSLSNQLQAAAIIINHTCTDITKIPATWINQAKSRNRCSYGHTSHGSQLITGMSAYMNDSAYTAYAFNTDGSIQSGVLSIADYTPEGDLGNPNFTEWEARTRYYLAHEGSNRNVVTCIAGWDGNTGAVTPAISVTSPNGGENWQAGSSHSIHWNTTGTVTNVTIEYSINNGSSWTTVVSNISNTNAYTWYIPSTPSTQCLIRVKNASGGTPSDTSNNTFTISPSEAPPTISLDKNDLYYSYVTGGSIPSTQTFQISNTGQETLNWTAQESTSWLDVSPTSGTNSSTVSVAVYPEGLTAGNYTGTINISDSYASNSPQTVTIHLTVKNSNQDQVPFGSFDSPQDGSTVCSSIALTGWALDDVEISSVKLYYENGSIIPTLIYIGEAVFIEGARPDIEAAHPTYPKNNKAGWGYMLLTNFLPNQGNGTFTLHAEATDNNGHTVTLGTKTINIDNINAVKPFGAIDTPTQGGIASGTSFVNFGWALTPLPSMIPIDGSSITVYIDGKAVGHPTYNQYRNDIADHFPGYYNTNGAIGYFYMDTTPYENGIHTIHWSVADNNGNEDGIGSRYFTIQNNSQTGKSISKDQLTPVNIEPIETLIDTNPIRIKKGWNETGNMELTSMKDGIFTTSIKPLERITIELYPEESPINPETPGKNRSTQIEGFVKTNNQYRKLPAGSTLDKNRHVFYWQPGPGFFGEYTLVFFSTSYAGKNQITTQKEIRIKIN